MLHVQLEVKVTAAWILWLLTAQHETGLATTFGPHDKLNPDPTLACYYPRKMVDSDYVVAHRTLKCRSKVVVCNIKKGLCTVARVADRGPYTKAVIDLSVPVAKALKTRGLAKVVIIPLD